MELQAGGGEGDNAMTTFLQFVCTHPETEWTNAAMAMSPVARSAVFRELAGLGLLA